VAGEAGPRGDLSGTFLPSDVRELGGHKPGFRNRPMCEPRFCQSPCPTRCPYRKLHLAGE
jgi:hypothetical protein